MSVWREVGGKYVRWLMMFSATAAVLIVIAKPLDHMSSSEHTSFLLQLLLAGSLMALNLFYFLAQMKDEKIARAVAFSIPASMLFFPDYVWGTLGGVFGALNPVISALLVMTLALAALNVGLHLTDALSARRKRPS